MEVKLIEKVKETNEIYSFIFEPQSPQTWKAGQFIYYRIPHDNPDNRGIVRHFTISSAPFEKNLRLTTNIYPQKGSSFKQALSDLKPGAKIEAYNIRGKFTVDSSESGFVFIGGGIGITPYRAILLDLEKKNALNDIIMLYSCRERNNVAFGPLWKKLEEKNQGLAVHYIFEPQRIDKHVIEKLVPGKQNRRFYISGPVNMVKAVQEKLYGLNIGKNQIVTDYFPGYD